MPSDELLKLRLVSKRWKRAVERSLENHAGRHPVLPRGKNGELEQSVVTLPENHFSYHRIRQCHLGVCRFAEPGDIESFLQRMGDYQGNPFPGKSVLVVKQFIRKNCYQGFEDTEVLLERFGEHVRELEMKNYNYETLMGLWFEKNCDLEMLLSMLKCLTLVPNIRSLIFSGAMFSVDDPERDAFFGDPESQDLFPVLQNLERFECRVKYRVGSAWIARMVENYGKWGGLRKLGISLNLLETLDLASFQAIHLMELHIFLETGFDGNADRIGGVVKGLPNHQEIQKFLLSSLEPTRRATKALDTNELIRMWAEFQFESVIVQDLKVVEESQLIPGALAQPPITVRLLDLEDNWERSLSYDFLRELPNLKLLNIYINDLGTAKMVAKYRRMKSEDKEVEDLEEKSLGKVLRRYFMMAYDPSVEIPENGGIWKEIPSLEMLSVSLKTTGDGVEGEWGRKCQYLGVRFVREWGNKAFFGPIPDVVDWDAMEETGARYL